MENEKITKYENLIELFKSLHKEKYDGQTAECKYFSNIEDSLEWLTNSKRQKTNILVTGSLYLVGLVLKVLNYEID